MLKVNGVCPFGDVSGEFCQESREIGACRHECLIDFFILNLTPHRITVVQSSGEKVTIDPEPIPARVGVTEQVLPQHSLAQIGIISLTQTGEVIGLPEEKPNTWYIVSRIVREACPEREDLLVPANIVRDTDGTIIGCQGFTIN